MLGETCGLSSFVKAIGSLQLIYRMPISTSVEKDLVAAKEPW